MKIKIKPLAIVKGVSDKLYNDVMEYAVKIYIEARKNAPVETGAGRDDIKIRFTTKKYNYISVTIGTKLRYMYYQHGGGISEFLKNNKWKYRYRHLPNFQSDARNKMAKLDINKTSPNRAWRYRYSRGYYQARYKLKILSKPVYNPYLWDAYNKYADKWNSIARNSTKNYLKELLKK